MNFTRLKLDHFPAGSAAVTGEHTTPIGFTAFISLEGKVGDEDTHQVSARGGIRMSPPPHLRKRKPRNAEGLAKVTPC